MIKDHPEIQVKDANGIKIKKALDQKIDPTPFPRYRIEDDRLIDRILNSLREKENAAHE